MDDLTDPEAGEGPESFKLSRHTLHADLVERLRDMIIEGHLRPGTRINEGRLAERVGVSRTPMREAIKFLASEGLIELVPGRGAVIKVLTPRDVEEMLEVQTALEATAARKACRVATAAQIAELRAIHDEMMRFYARRDRLEYYKRNQAFHVGLARLAGNRFLAAHYDAIQVRLKRIRFLGNVTPENWRGAVAEHEAMIAALEARDGEALARVVTDHLVRTWERVKDTI